MEVLYYTDNGPYLITNTQLSSNDFLYALVQEYEGVPIDDHFVNLKPVEAAISGRKHPPRKQFSPIHFKKIFINRHLAHRIPNRACPIDESDIESSVRARSRDVT